MPKRYPNDSSQSKFVSTWQGFHPFTLSKVRTTQKKVSLTFHFEQFLLVVLMVRDRFDLVSTHGYGRVLLIIPPVCWIRHTIKVIFRRIKAYCDHHQAVRQNADLQLLSFQHLQRGPWLSRDRGPPATVWEPQPACDHTDLAHSWVSDLTEMGRALKTIAIGSGSGIYSHEGYLAILANRLIFR